MFFWIAVVVLIGLLFVLWKFKSIGHRIFLIFFVLLLIFLLISATSVVNNNHIQLNSLKNILTTGKLYFSWLGDLAGNIKTIVGHAIKMDWRNVTG